jgi:ABC-2 type transport system permease protein
MNFILMRKLLRDLRPGLLAVCVLLGTFEFLWCKVTEQAIQVMRAFERQMIVAESVIGIVMRQESGRILDKMLGGANITFGQGLDSLTIGYVHPLVLTILCFWAIGRSAGAIAGELDKGTMELLLAQPIARWRVIISHLAVDLVTIPLLCLCMWGGTGLGTLSFNLLKLTAHEGKPIDAWRFGLALPNVAGLLFAVSGTTMLLSSMSRFRTRVLGCAVLLALVQFLINLLGQVWTDVEPLRPFTVFYFYQPQPIVLGVRGAEWQALRNVATLMGVGLAGYAGALLIFCRRDLPAPL